MARVHLDEEGRIPHEFIVRSALDMSADKPNHKRLRSRVPRAADNAVGVRQKLSVDTAQSRIPPGVTTEIGTLRALFEHRSGSGLSSEIFSVRDRSTLPIWTAVFVAATLSVATPTGHALSFAHEVSAYMPVEHEVAQQEAVASPAEAGRAIGELDARLGGQMEICSSDVPPVSGAGVTNIFSPNSPPAREIRDLSYLVFAICIAIFVIVQGFLAVAIVRGVKAARAAKLEAARNPTAARREPVQVYGSVPIEIAWTVIPVIIVFVLSMVTIRTIRDLDLTAPPKGALEVSVIGHQWWWEFRYIAEDGTVVTTANEMHVPTGRPIWLRLESADVIHSFWVPRLAGKKDLIPGHMNTMWFNAEQVGLYLGQCAEYCGTQHAHMLLRVYADAPADFAAWLDAQAMPAIEDPTTTVGRKVFSEYACLNCHAIAGTSSGMFGPNLTHLASRDTIGSGYIELTRANLRQWIADPQVLKPGCNMPSLQLSDTELDAVTDYLMTLK